MNSHLLLIASLAPHALCAVSYGQPILDPPAYASNVPAHTSETAVITADISTAAIPAYGALTTSVQVIPVPVEASMIVVPDSTLVTEVQSIPGSMDEQPTTFVSVLVPVLTETEVTTEIVQVPTTTTEIEQIQVPTTTTEIEQIQVPTTTTEIIQVQVPTTTTEIFQVDVPTETVQIEQPDTTTEIIQVQVPTTTTEIVQIQVPTTITEIVQIPTTTTEIFQVDVPTETVQIEQPEPTTEIIQIQVPTTTTEIEQPTITVSVTSTPVAPGVPVGRFRPNTVTDFLPLRRAAAQCGNGQVLSCCNSRTGSSIGSLAGSLLANLIGGNCDQVPINIIGANGILMDACGSNQAACCTGDENSLINVPCIPVSA